MFKTVLFPIDQSKEALETAGKAIELAKSHDSHFIMLAVIQEESPEMENLQSLTSLLNRTKEQVKQAGFNCDVIERIGKPAFVICDIAHELNVDVIVMGAKGVDLEKDKESTVARVIQLAPCPVLVVP